MEDATFLKSEFDWDAIDVGDYRLDHSQNFFGKNIASTSFTVS